MMRKAMVLQDLSASGGFYTVPGGKDFVFGVHATQLGCAGNVNIGGFVVPLGRSSQGGMLQAGQTVTNNADCVATLNGYLK